MINKLRVFLVSNMYPSETDPLFGVFVKNFKLQIESKGVQFTQMAVIEGKTQGKFNKLKRYLRYYLAVVNAYREGNFDLIYVHFLSHNAPILLLLNWLSAFKKPLIINVHGSDVIESEGTWIDVLNKQILKKARMIVVPSLAFQSLMLHRYPFLAASDLFVSPSGGINTQTFYPSEEKKKKETFHIGLVSRIDAGKGWHTFLQALRILKNKDIRFKASIVGSGLEDDLLRQTIGKYQLSKEVTFVGLVPQHQLVAFYHSFDVSVFPSEIKNESLGLVGLEAMSCGTPVIGSSIPAIETYLEDGQNGLLFETGNEASLAEKIIQFYRLPESEKKEFSLKAVEKAKEFDAENVSSQLKCAISKYV